MVTCLKQGTVILSAYDRKVAAPCDSEIKVTVLVGRAIDAPVENNPVCLIRGWMMKQQESQQPLRS